MIKFFYNGAPNPLKIALFLEEAGLDYEAIPVDTKRGDQHTAEYRAINPNSKVPAIIDGDITIFDSNAILLYLAEKTGQFLPTDGGKSRGQLLSWLMFVASGIGPYSGQAVHFRHFAPGENPYARDRYAHEARRHWQIIEDRLAASPYMLGGDYSIVDMSVWGWATRIPFMMGDDAMAGYPSLARLMAEINARPAAARAVSLPDRHPFQQAFDDDAIRNLYPHIFAARQAK
ncbi:glutathione S-transferase family protein [Hoeflea ulvae]|uniref:Glutathione S-transferase family protein n=1 Tax=Hoeflea ulvae TaxID=2983764 RepID=A0ABT3YD29_9HYPH|nr:glutathione S-transferase family protein [Hoeflea ulvae]MCY0093789.1 glutathione S-transferase family protein [Hoeflea ulvae]